MDWTIDYLKEDGIIHAKMSGIITWEENKKMDEELFSFARSNGAHRFLLEHPKFEHNLSLLQIDDLPKLLKEFGLGAEDKLAILVSPSSRHIKELKFLEDVSRLALLQVRFFTDFEQAVNWLKADQTSKMSC